MLTPVEQAPGTPALSLHTDPILQVATTGNVLAQLLGDLLPDRLYCLPCSAKWSMHHVLEHLVLQVGPADVRMTSWTITEAPMRRILQLKDAGHILQLRCVFDERVRKNNPNAAQLAFANVAEIGLTGIHAKCLVVQGARGSVTVCSTANITRNKNIELYWLSTAPAVATFHAQWIDQVLEGCNQRQRHA